jgi:hypothetical protein
VGGLVGAELNLANSFLSLGKTNPNIAQRRRNVTALWFTVINHHDKTQLDIIHLKTLPE